MTTPKVRTCLLFDGKAEEAARFYVSLLPGSAIETVSRLSAEAVLAVEFTIAGVPYLALNVPMEMPFSPATSISVLTASQDELDTLWAKIGEGGKEGRCGWIADRFGFSWQLVPHELPAMMMADDKAAAQRAQAALMGMTKIDIGAIKRAFNGEEETA